MNEKLEREHHDDEWREELGRLKEQLNQQNHLETSDNDPDKKQLDTVSAKEEEETSDKLRESQENLETLTTRKEMSDLQAEVAQQPTGQKPIDYEQMSEEEIADRANVGRQQSVDSVHNMVQSTSRIPDIIKKNV